MIQGCSFISPFLLYTMQIVPLPPKTRRHALESIHPPYLDQRKVDTILVINISLLCLNSLSCSPKYNIPKPGLLPIISTLPIPLSMMQIMILSRQLCAYESKEETARPRCITKHPQSTVSESFREDEILVTDPPIVKPHREAEYFESCPCEGRD